MTKKQSQKPDSSKNKLVEIVVAKYGVVGAIIAAILGIVGTGITAYFGYLSTQTQIKTPIQATQTAEARATATIITTTLSLVPSIQMSPTTIAANPSQEYKILYPNCNCNEYVSQNEKIVVRLRWGGKTAEFAEIGADFVKYTISINGNLIDDITNYRKPAIFAEIPIIEGDLANTWWVYWDIPVGKLDGYPVNIVEAKLDILTAVDNGWDIIPAGITKTFRVTAHTSLMISPLPTPAN